MSDTPRTDAARLKLDSDDSSCAIYAHTLDGSSYHGEVVRGDEMAILERENAAMREAIGDSDAALRKCLNYILRLPLSGSDAECETMDDAHHALRVRHPLHRHHLPTTMNRSTTINDGGPAFPVPDVYHPNGQIEYGSPGMSLRAYFAGQALTGLLANSEGERTFHEIDWAVCAVRQADALIAELNKTQQ